MVMSVLWGMDLANVFVFQSLGVLLPIWEEELGVTTFQGGLLGSAGFLGFGLMALPASIWFTKYNPKLMVLLLAGGMAVTVSLQGITSVVAWLIMGRFLFLMCSVSRIQMQVVFIQQWFQPRLYAMINSLDFGNRSIGQALALMVTPILITMFGNWRLVYWGVAVWLFILALIWIVIGKENRTLNPISDNATEIGNPIKVLQRHKVLWLVSGAQVGLAFTFGAFATFYPAYVIDKFGFSLSTVGILFGFMPIGSIVGSISSGPLSQIIGKRKPFIWIPGIFLPLIYCALVYAGSEIIIAILFFAAGYLAMSVPPIVSTIPFDMKLSPREITVALGLNRTLFPFAAAVGPLLVGIIGESSGSLGWGLLLVSPLSVTLLICGILIPETGGQNRIE
jgi:MFS family permease